MSLSRAASTFAIVCRALAVLLVATNCYANEPPVRSEILKSGVGRNERNMGAAAVALDMDITIGQVLDKLDELGIADKSSNLRITGER